MRVLSQWERWDWLAINSNQRIASRDAPGDLNVVPAIRLHSEQWADPAVGRYFQIEQAEELILVRGEQALARTLT